MFLFLCAFYLYVYHSWNPTSMRSGQKIRRLNPRAMLHVLRSLFKPSEHGLLLSGPLYYGMP
jgi:hypothetical protein